LGWRSGKNVGGARAEYVYFGGQVIAEKHANGTWSDYIYANGQRLARWDSTQTIDIRFTNDSCSACGGSPVGGGDRNLYINSIVAGQTTVQQSDPNVSFTSAPCNAYYGSQATLLCTGDMVDASAPAGDPVTISAWGSPDYGIYPHMQVFLNGELAGEWDVTGSAQNYTVYPSHFYSADHLGTARVITNGQGAVQNASEFYPFGQEPGASDPVNHYKFTGYERDAESGLDYASARHYNSGMGRFMSPDPSGLGYADQTNPQSFNLYSYVMNNPLSNTDPTGMTCQTNSTDGSTYDDGDGKGCSTIDQADATDLKNGNYSDTVYANMQFMNQAWSAMSNGYGPISTGDGYSGPAASGAAPNNVPTISPAVCTGAAIAGGASAGALIGEGVGGFVGGLLGGGGGTLVAPGVGTVGGGIAGTSAGAGIGAGVGGFIGGLVGGAASNILCSKGGGSSFGGNQRENKQANDAKNEAERITGKKFTRAQERVFHDEITGQGYGYHELVQIAVQVLQGVI
jgi:RHS repeat-associated protein